SAWRRALRALHPGRRSAAEPPQRIEEGIERRDEGLTRFPERGLDYCERLRDGLLALLGGTLLLQPRLEPIVAHRAEACDLDAPARAQFFVRRNRRKQRTAARIPR